MPGMIETPANSSAHATIAVYPNYLRVIGYGGKIPDVELTFDRVTDGGEGGMLDELLGGIKVLLDTTAHFALLVSRYIYKRNLTQF